MIFSSVLALAVLSSASLAVAPPKGSEGLGKQALAPRAEAEGMKIYRDIAASQLDAALLQKSFAKIRALVEKDKGDPIANALMVDFVLTASYSGGEWYSPNGRQQGAIEEARKYSVASLEKGKAMYLPNLVAAQLAMVEYKFKEAKEFLNQANSSFPDTFDVSYLRGVIEHLQLNLKEAQEFYVKAEIHADENNLDRVRYRRYEVADRLGDVKLAEELLLAIIKGNPKKPQVYGNYAKFLVDQNRYDEGIANYEKAIKLGSYPLAVHNLADAFYMKALELSVSRKFDQALPLLQKSLALDSDYGLSNFMLGKILLAQKKFELAKKPLEFILSKYGQKKPFFNFYLAYAYEGLGQKEKSRELYGKRFSSISISDKFPADPIEKTWALDFLKRTEEISILQQKEISRLGKEQIFDPKSSFVPELRVALAGFRGMKTPIRFQEFHKKSAEAIETTIGYFVEVEQDPTLRPFEQHNLETSGDQAHKAIQNGFEAVRLSIPTTGLDGPTAGNLYSHLYRLKSTWIPATVPGFCDLCD